ncbi:hypothetical protein F511_46200 [Dorcoceras hygrometricum]|uniref:Uncharacterized protein n=1 Tax=Dorcoceras hygrometricum TaxID=472368 RepID=A0A2Z7A152_9LAMI|nr:hypothetical protein F511_46200 [Dorcoceras hygrometricum]
MRAAAPIDSLSCAASAQVARKSAREERRGGHRRMWRRHGRDCGRYRQSGPRPEPRLLRQAALEALTNSARTDSPRRVGRKRISGDDGRQRRTAGGGGGGLFVREGGGGF